jgi:hypothetical protein
LNLQRNEWHNSRAAPAREYAVYGAFISYSHALDKPVAAALQSCVRQVQQMGMVTCRWGSRPKSRQPLRCAGLTKFLTDLSLLCEARLRDKQSFDPSSAQRPEIASLFAMTVGNW